MTWPADRPPTVPEAAASAAVLVGVSAMAALAWANTRRAWRAGT